VPPRGDGCAALLAKGCDRWRWRRRAQGCGWIQRRRLPPERCGGCCRWLARKLRPADVALLRAAPLPESDGRSGGLRAAGRASLLIGLLDPRHAKPCLDRALERRCASSTIAWRLHCPASSRAQFDGTCFVAGKIAGYKAVLLAAPNSIAFFPMPE